MQIPWHHYKRPGPARSQHPGDGSAGKQFPQTNKTIKISNLMRAGRRIGFTLMAAAWRREHPDNKGMDYKFVPRGTGIEGSEPNLEIRWFMNTDFRLALLRDWQKDEPGKVIDFTRYDVPAREPADPTAGNPSRNWRLINRINQKNLRPEDAPVPLKALTKEEPSLIRKRYPALFL
jgi:hypothetical protein